MTTTPAARSSTPGLIHVDEHGLVAAVTGPGVVVIEASAAWCGPCKALAPVLDRLAGDYAGRAAVVAFDVDQCPAIAQRLRVTSMPTVMLFRDGREVGRVVGTRSHRFLAGVVERALAGDVAISAP